MTAEGTAPLGPQQLRATLTPGKKSSGRLKTNSIRSTDLGISDTFFKRPIQRDTKGICGTLVKEKKFPETRAFLPRGMVTVHDGASQKPALGPVQHYTKHDYERNFQEGFFI